MPTPVCNRRRGGRLRREAMPRSGVEVLREGSGRYVECACTLKERQPCGIDGPFRTSAFPIVHTASSGPSGHLLPEGEGKREPSSIATRVEISPSGLATVAGTSPMRVSTTAAGACSARTQALRPTRLRTPRERVQKEKRVRAGEPVAERRGMRQRWWVRVTGPGDTGCRAYAPGLRRRAASGPAPTRDSARRR